MIFAAEEGGGVQFPPIENIVNWKPWFGEDTAYQFDKVSFIALLAMLIPTIIFFLAKGGSAENPSKIRIFGEKIVEFVEEQIAKPGIGHGYEPFIPLLTSLFLFISLGNLFEVIPFFQMPLNARMGAPVVLAIIVYLMWIAVGAKHHGGSFFKEALFPPGVPKPLYLLVTPIELLSTFIIRPFSHAVRLFANMLAGHILLVTFSVLVIATFKLAAVSILGFVGSFAGLVAFTAFEIGVSFIQGFVFAILAAVYIGLSLHPSH